MSLRWSKELPSTNSVVSGVANGNAHLIHAVIDARGQVLAAPPKPYSDSIMHRAHHRRLTMSHYTADARVSCAQERIQHGKWCSRNDIDA